MDRAGGSVSDAKITFLGCYVMESVERHYVIA